jgi:hypothetical protein
VATPQAAARPIGPTTVHTIACGWETKPLESEA